MPELPEVEIVRQSLNRQVKNHKIINIQVNNRNLRLKVPKNFEKIFKNAVIEKIQRKSDWTKLPEETKTKLFNVYGNLYDKVNNLPPVFLKEKK